jgi:two-component system, NarL family, nitrate/nitrite response regulator NarL
MKILLAAPKGRSTDVLCLLLGKLGPAHSIETTPGLQFLTASDPAPADVLLLDIDAAEDAPGMVAAASRRHPRSQVVALGTPLDNAFVEAILEAGALGYLPKSLSEIVTLGMLRMIVGGAGNSSGDSRNGKPRKKISPAAASTDTAAEPWLEFGLTARQTDVLALVAEGKTNQSIAKQLGITEGVVKLHATAVYKALKVRNRNEAVLLALRSKNVNFRQIKEAEGGRLDLDWLLAHMTHQRMAPGTVLFKQGEPGRELYYLQRGAIRLPEIGIEMASGAMFGEIGIFSPTHMRTSSAICATEADVFKLTADQVKRLYLLNPQFALYVVHLIAKRLMADQTRTI